VLHFINNKGKYKMKQNKILTALNLTSTAQHSTAQHSTAQHSTAQHSTI